MGRHEGLATAGQLTDGGYMRLSCGVDLVEIDRVAAVIGRWGDRFLTRVFTDAERAYCRGRVPELAVRFAAKEAVSKALGTGIVGMAWRDIEVVPDPRGKPLVVLHNRAKNSMLSIVFHKNKFHLHLYPLFQNVLLDHQLKHKLI